jgi:hypothetical protein
MYKFETTTVFGPFCGGGGYGSETFVGMDKSPKKAIEKATSRKHRFDGSCIRRTDNENPETGICGGGVPVLAYSRLSKNGKTIRKEWD